MVEPAGDKDYVQHVDLWKAFTSMYRADLKSMPKTQQAFKAAVTRALGDDNFRKSFSYTNAAGKGTSKKSIWLKYSLKQ